MTSDTNILVCCIADKNKVNIVFTKNSIQCAKIVQTH